MRTETQNRQQNGSSFREQTGLSLKNEEVENQETGGLKLEEGSKDSQLKITVNDETYTFFSGKPPNYLPIKLSETIGLNRDQKIQIAGIVVTLITAIIGSNGLTYYLTNNQISVLGENLNSQIAVVDQTVEINVQQLDQLTTKVQNVDSNVRKLKVTNGEITVVPPQPFSITQGWTAYGGLEVKRDPTSQRLTFNGNLLGGSGGYVKEHSSLLSFSGRKLTLTVVNSGNSSFDANKMFKLEANGQPVIPQEQGRINTNDTSFVNAGNGTISFKLPNDLTKLEFVFWNTNLNDLTISGIVSEP
ncbi:hypothetical protein [Crocosphaera sp.]|uniref:hypothetical protein n=1 Tax=Crocosphaera sp. TaxID=2729996 RepID=UPI002615FCAF|nr:hypothetical protein [Crocosphaera sp.]MDJ0580242.1 hypothetical protein [Crocosphaera sp.]